MQNAAEIVALIAAVRGLIETPRLSAYRFTPGAIAAAEKAVRDAERAVGIRPRPLDADAQHELAVRFGVLARIGPPDAYPAA